MKVIGPALGGVMIAVFGAAGNFWVQGAAYIVVLSMIQLMHVPPTRADALRASAMANLKEGFAYVRSTPNVLALMILAYVPRVFAVPYQTLMPVFQKDVLQVGPEGLGLLMAAPGLGAVLAVLTLASISSRIRRQGLMLIVSTIMLGLSLILFFSNHLFSFGADCSGHRRRISNGVSREYQHNAAAHSSGRATGPGDEPVHA